MLEGWRNGAHVVHTVRTRQGEAPLKMWLTRQAYRVIHAGSTIELPVEAGDFKLFSRRAVDRILELGESDPYLRGLASWVGFNQALVPYERQPPHGGQTHFPLVTKNPLEHADSWPTLILLWAIYLVEGVALVGSLAGTLILLSALGLALARQPAAGTTGLIGLLVTLWATTLAAVAAVGIYIIRIHKDVRGRPQYIIESTWGLRKPAVHPAQS